MQRIPIGLATAAALALAAPAAAQVTLQTGDVIVTDITLDQVYRVDPVTGARTTLASGGVLQTPRAVAIGPSGLLYVTESGDADAVIRIDPTLPVTSNQVIVTSGGVFSSPRGIVIGPLGDLLVAEPNDDAIYRVHPASGAVSVYSAASSVEADADTFHFPSDIALDEGDGSLLVTDAPSGPVKRLLRVPPLGGFPVELSDSSLFQFPRGVAVEANRNIVVADSIQRAVFRFFPATSMLTSLSSGGSLNSLRGIAVDRSNGNLFVADFGAKAVFRIDPGSGIPTLLTSGPTLGPWGIAVVGSIAPFAASSLLVADGGTGPGAGMVIRVTPTVPPPYGSSVVAELLAAPVALTKTRSGAPWNEAILVANGDAVTRIDEGLPPSVTTLSQGGLLANVTGIVVDEIGDVLVTDSGTDAVVRIAPDGTQSLVGTPGGELSDPAALVIDRDGLLVVAARFTDGGPRTRLLRVNPLTGQRRIVSEGVDLHEVRALALDPSGDVLIADHQILPGAAMTPLGSVLRLDARFETLDLVAESIANSIESIQGVVSDANRDVLVTNQGQTGTSAQTILRIDPLLPAAQPVVATGVPFAAIRGIALDAPPPAFSVADADGDLFGDSVDNCPNLANPDQSDVDADALGDVCDLDDDNDGVPDTTDNCLFFPNSDQVNSDSDDFGDACDNCPTVSNPDQANNENDAEGDLCDTDDDNDGILDTADNCTFVPNTTQADADANGFGNLCDADFDLPPDGCVGIRDFALLAVNFGRNSGFPARVDLDGSGSIGIGDFGIFSTRFGFARGPSASASDSPPAPCPFP